MTELLSYSQLNSFTSCPEQYRLERIEKVPQVPAWWFIGGNTVHEMTENHDLLSVGVDVPNVTFQDVFERRTLEAEEESGVDRVNFRAGGRQSKTWPDKENDRWWLAEGPAMVNRWVTWRQRCPWDIWIAPDGAPAVELGFELYVHDKTAKVRGVLDRVMVDQAGQLIVVDLKSGSSKQATPRQLGTYKVAVEDRFPGVTVRFGTFWDARGGATSPVYPLNEYSLRRLEWQYGAFRHARETGLYLPNPSRCSSCGVKDYCYEFSPGAERLVRPPWVTVEEWEAQSA